MTLFVERKMSLHLFTLVADYAGGTYISQCCASDARSAVMWWVDQGLQEISALRVDRRAKEKVRRELLSGEEQPVALAGIKGVWCAGVVSLRGKLLLLNVVKTKGRANQRPDGMSAKASPSNPGQVFGVPQP